MSLKLGTVHIKCNLGQRANIQRKSQYSLQSTDDITLAWHKILKPIICYCCYAVYVHVPDNAALLEIYSLLS